MKKTFLFLFLTFILGCKKTEDFKTKDFGEGKDEISNPDSRPKIYTDKNTIKERFAAPENHSWLEEKTNSFGEFIVSFPLEKYSSPILKYDGTKISNQNLHEAIFKIDTGNRDLQQCADAIIRLRAEYLWKQKRFDEIKFHFTSGDLVSWNDYKNGTRAFVNGNRVTFKKAESFDDSYKNFRNYLDLIFNYAGTISLNRATKPVLKTEDLKTGDILITPGSPGHVVFIAGVSKNSEGKKLFLLGEGFTPAQSINIMKNPFNPKISPWYELELNAKETKTARYFFKPGNFRSF